MTTKTKPTIGLRLIGRVGKPPFSRWERVTPREYVVVADTYYKHPETNRHPYASIVDVSLYAQQGGSFLAVRPVDEQDVRKDKVTIRYFGGTRWGRSKAVSQTMLVSPSEVQENVERYRESHDEALARYADLQGKHGTGRYPDLSEADRLFVVDVVEGFDWFYLVAQSAVASTDPEAWRAEQAEQEEARRKAAEAKRDKAQTNRDTIAALEGRLAALRLRGDVPEEVIELLDCLKPFTLNRWDEPDVRQVSWKTFTNALYALEGVPDETFPPEEYRSCDECGKHEHHDEAEGDWPDGVCEDCRPLTKAEEAEEAMRRA